MKLHRVWSGSEGKGAPPDDPSFGSKAPSPAQSQALFYVLILEFRQSSVNSQKSAAEQNGKTEDATLTPF